MATYIEREDAKQRLVHDYAYAAADMLDAIPAADVVAVVRCKECKHHQREQDPCHGGTEHYCMKLKAEVYKDFFCAYGERRGEE